MQAWTWLLWATALVTEPVVANKDFNRFHRHQQAKALQRSANANQHKYSTYGKSNYRYHTDKTSPYLIEKWPDVNFNTGEFYSGSVPIDESNPDRTLFFIFKPAINGPVDEVTIWLNGGPGCSSLVGFFQENGPILWQPGTYEPTSNPYSWASITNMLWVEQPVGVGFSVGQIRAKNEVDLSKDFVKWFKNWQNLFDIENYKIYVTVSTLTI